MTIDTFCCDMKYHKSSINPAPLLNKLQGRGEMGGGGGDLNISSTNPKTITSKSSTHSL